MKQEGKIIAIVVPIVAVIIGVLLSSIIQDIDGDGILDNQDNCPDIVNRNQLDSDNNGIGDKCDVKEPSPIEDKSVIIFRDIIYNESRLDQTNENLAQAIKKLDELEKKAEQDEEKIEFLKNEIERLSEKIDTINTIRFEQLQGNTDKTISLYNAYLEKDPNDIDLRKELANQYFTNHELSLAIIEYSNILAEKKYENDVDILNNIGLAYLEVNDRKDSQFYLEKALDLAPDNYIVLNSNGVLQHFIHNYVESTELFEKALDVKPDFIAAKSNHAILLALQEDNVIIAMEELSDVLQDNPENILIERNLNLLKQIQEYEDLDKIPVRYYQGDVNNPNPRPIESDKNYASFTFLTDTASQIFDANAFRLAIHYYEEALDIIDDDIDVLNHLGEAYLEIERYPKSLEYYEQVLKLEPDNLNAQIGKANSKVHQPLLVNEAVSEFHEIVKVYPTNVNAIIGLGNTYLELSKYDKALFECDKALKFDPDNANAHKCIGRAHYGLGNLDAARVHFEKALALSTGNIDTLLALYKIALETNTGEDPDHYLSQIHLSNTQKNSALTILAEEYVQNENYKIANAILNTVLQNDPSNKEAQRLLSNIPQ